MLPFREGQNAKILKLELLCFDVKLFYRKCGIRYIFRTVMSVEQMPRPALCLSGNVFLKIFDGF